MKLNVDPDFAEKLDDYLDNVRRSESEEGKAFLFLEFVRATFKGLSTGQLGHETYHDLFPVLQKYIKRKSGIAVVGRPDALLGNLIIEFKLDLAQFQADAESQLKRYVSILWSNQGQKRVSYLVIATDGLRFQVYRPTTSQQPGASVEPSDIRLSPLDDADLPSLSQNPNATYTWLDRYVLYRTQIPPTGHDFAIRFGPTSPTYKQASLLLKEAWESARKSSETAFEEWGRYLRYVYGSPIANLELFLKHSYLATLAKFTVYSYYTDGKPPKSKEELLAVVRGTAFAKWNLRNFLEEDFFSWLGKPEVESLCVQLGDLVLDVLATFDVTTIDVDVLKTLYQELVDPAERHDLGEYYTPDWLAELVVERALRDDPSQSVIDPSCGSGTFLVVALHYKQRALSSKSPQEILDHVSESVVGIDIHPLAVIVSKTNYLLAVRELLRRRTGGFTVPVYLGNSIVLPKEIRELGGLLRTYAVEVDLGRRKVSLRIPSVVAQDPKLADPVISVLKDYSLALVSGQEADREDFREQLHSTVPSLATIDSSGAVTDVLFSTATGLKNLVKGGRDSIWAFILRNIYRPVFLSQKRFDAIVGNPPWLSFRYVEDPEYQVDLKALTKTYGISPSSALITHMELATLFFLRCSDLYLKPAGSISFVMPRSVFVADQHVLFRSRETPPGITCLVDLEEVTPLFNVPSCVVVAQNGRSTSYPATGLAISGELPSKNAKLGDALPYLTLRETQFVLNTVGQRSFLSEGTKPLTFAGRSPYYSRVTQGATIVPRSCWLVDLVPDEKVGIDPQFPNLRSSQRAIAMSKEDWKDVRLSGNVESKFLYGVITGSELAPFCHTPLPLAVLPIESDGKSFRIIDRAEANRRGFKGLASWLGKVEGTWTRIRGDKASKMSIYERLDWSSTLTGQNPTAAFKVVYNASGTNLCACVIRQHELPFKSGGFEIPLQGAVADAKVYRFETNDVGEANYFAAIMNSTFLDRLVKPLQSRGQWGERDFHKKPLEFPIPKFKRTLGTHSELTKLGGKCAHAAEAAVGDLSESYDSIGKIRGEIRRAISDDLARIDELVPVVFGKGLPKLDDFA